MARWASGSRLERSSTAERPEGLEAGARRVDDAGRRAAEIGGLDFVVTFEGGSGEGWWVVPRQC
jgi:hypothetical protein